jgi:hypothetical protein
MGYVSGAGESRWRSCNADAHPWRRSERVLPWRLDHHGNGGAVKRICTADGLFVWLAVLMVATAVSAQPPRRIARVGILSA